MHRWIVFIGAALLVMAGCAAQKPTTANDYFKIASGNLRDGAYEQAVENYRNLLDEHPFSDYSEEAELKIGVAHYKTGSCPEATAAFTDMLATLRRESLREYFLNTQEWNEDTRKNVRLFTNVLGMAG